MNFVPPLGGILQDPPGDLDLARLEGDGGRQQPGHPAGGPPLLRERPSRVRPPLVPVRRFGYSYRCHTMTRVG